MRVRRLLNGTVLAVVAAAALLAATPPAGSEIYFDMRTEASGPTAVPSAIYFDM